MDEYETQLAREFFVDLIGQQKEACKREAKDRGFVFLDSWNTKMGFAKEDDNRTCILSLFFSSEGCQDFQLIIKSDGRTWSEAEMIDSDAAKTTLRTDNGET